METVAGATYTLSLDVAGRPGYGAEFTQIGIYVDGVRLGGDASTSRTGGLDWQTQRFSFVGSGAVQSIRIVSEAGRFDANGRGMMVDNIALTETLPANTGLEDTAIRLCALSAALKDTDGSETLKLTIEGVPIGATLSDGVRRFTATAGNTTADVSTWKLAQLSILPPQDYHGEFVLKVVASATEQANGARAFSEALLRVTVLAVDDVPVAKSASLSLPRNGSIDIDFAALVGDADGDLLTLSLASPRNGTLTRNDDGSYRYTPKPGFVGSDGFSYTVTDGRHSATGSVSLSVLACATKSAELRVDSAWVSGPIRTQGGSAYIVLNQGKAPLAPTLAVDWNASAPRLGEAHDAAWLTEYFIGRDEDRRSLAEITGLVIKR